MIHFEQILVDRCCFQSRARTAQRPDAAELDFESISIFSVSCEVQHFAVFSRIGAKCEVQGGLIPGHVLFFFTDGF